MKQQWLTLIWGGAFLAACSGPEMVIPDSGVPTEDVATTTDTGAIQDTNRPDTPTLDTNNTVDVVVPESGPETSIDTGSGATNGSACSSNTACRSGFCVDGVCCNTSCNGTCERCDVSPSVGTCSPIPDGQDPDIECDPAATTPPADGGVTDSGTSDAGRSDTGTADTGTADGGTGPQRTACGGVCNGSRTCRFPDNTQICANPSCNTTTNSAVNSTCNGQGQCISTPTACNNIRCASGQCPAFCANDSNCVTGMYCNGTSQQCVRKLADGNPCVTDNQCQNAHCVQPPTGSTASPVCCNVACGPPLSCHTTGSVGRCSCGPGLNCTMGCTLFYRDSDADGFGDRNGSVAMNTAQAGCVGSAPPSGFVDNNTDCDDRDNRAFPGQTNSFTTQRTGVGGFDFNCDGSETKLYAEYATNATCGFCRPPVNNTCGSPQSTCTSSGAQSQLECDLNRLFLCFPSPCTSYCCGCSPIIIIGGGPPDTQGFRGAVGCGATGNFVSCGTCAAVNGTVSTSPFSRVQACR